MSNFETSIGIIIIKIIQFIDKVFSLDIDEKEDDDFYNYV